jgi:flagellar basal body rod protein FlgG
LVNNYRMDVFANNLANVNTIGFKHDLAVARTRDTKAIEDGVDLTASGQLLEALGAGVLAAPQRVSFSVGAPEHTGNSTDAALTQRNAFFAVKADTPDANGESIRLSRDGRFMTNARGELVTPDGHAVLDASDRPISLEPGVPFAVRPDGYLEQNNAVVAQLGVSSVDDLDALSKQGGNLFVVARPSDRETIDTPVLKVGHLEGSAVDPISAMMSVTRAASAAQSNLRMLTYHDQLMDRAINTFARVG